MGLLEGIADYFHTSENEGLRNKYSDLVNSVNKKISNARDCMNELRDGFDEQKKCLRGDPKDATGCIANILNSKTENFIKEVETLYNYFNDMLDGYTSKLDTARSRLEYYEEQCILEDEAKKKSKKDDT